MASGPSGRCGLSAKRAGWASHAGEYWNDQMLLRSASSPMTSLLMKATSARLSIGGGLLGGGRLARGCAQLPTVRSFLRSRDLFRQQLGARLGNVYRHARPQPLQYLEQLAPLNGLGAPLHLDHKGFADTDTAGCIILPQLLCFAHRTDDGTDFRWAADRMFHKNLAERTDFMEKPHSKQANLFDCTDFSRAAARVCHQSPVRGLK